MMESYMATAGRPRTFDRDEALKKAMLIFWEKGYEGTTMANLIEAIGMKAPSVYAAFGNKDKLFNEVVNLYAGIVNNGPLRLLKEQKDVYKAFKELFIENIRIFTSEDNPTSCLIMTAAINCAPEHSEHVETLKYRRSTYKDAFVARFEQAIADGQLAVGADAVSLAEFYTTFAHGLALRAKDGASKTELETSSEFALLALKSVLKESN
jgi:AcrR family transcriptional regulator